MRPADFAYPVATSVFKRKARRQLQVYGKEEAAPIQIAAHKTLRQNSEPARRRTKASTRLSAGSAAVAGTGAARRARQASRLYNQGPDGGGQAGMPTSADAAHLRQSDGGAPSLWRLRSHRLQSRRKRAVAGRKGARIPEGAVLEGLGSSDVQAHVQAPPASGRSVIEGYSGFIRRVWTEPC